jgi:hypothetical protein
VIEDDAKERVSPSPVVFDAVSAPNHFRTGVPVESHTSIPAVVIAGMFVNVMAPPEVVRTPADAFARALAMDCAAYVEPLAFATSVPVAVEDPFADISRNIMGVVGAGKVIRPNEAFSMEVASTWTRFAMSQLSSVAAA